MIEKIVDSQTKIKFIMPYCLYPYGNYLKYGLDKENFSIYKCNKIFFSVYNKSLHVFQKLISFKTAEEIATFALQNKVADIRGSTFAIKRIKKYIQNSKIEFGYALKLFNNKHDISLDKMTILEAKEEERFNEIADLVCDVNLKHNSNFFSKEEYFKQIYERYLNGYTRNYYLKVNDEIIASCSTYAETPEYAVLGGLVVKGEYQKQHLGSKLFLYTVNKVIEDNKNAWLFCFNSSILGYYFKFTDKKYKYCRLYIKY